MMHSSGASSNARHMNHTVAMGLVQRLRAGEECSVNWVSPAVSAILAAVRIARVTTPVTFQGHALEYARINGLRSVLEGEPVPRPESGALCGTTYSPLASLATHPEVNACNERIGSVLQNALRAWPPAVLSALLDIIGELHDNVASHARARGYSAAQVYGSRLEYVVADCGQGLLKNAKRVRPMMTTDVEAVEWAFERGTTSCGDEPDPMAQRMPEDHIYGDAELGDHHQGIGLAKVRDVVDRAGGSLWVATGSAHRVYGNGRWRDSYGAQPPWPGLAIELDIPLDVAAKKIT